MKAGCGRGGRMQRGVAPPSCTFMYCQEGTFRVDLAHFFSAFSETCRTFGALLPFFLSWLAARFAPFTAALHWRIGARRPCEKKKREMCGVGRSARCPFSGWAGAARYIIVGI